MENPTITCRDKITFTFFSRGSVSQQKVLEWSLLLCHINFCWATENVILGSPDGNYSINAKFSPWPLRVRNSLLEKVKRWSLSCIYYLYVQLSFGRSNSDRLNTMDDSNWCECPVNFVIFLDKRYTFSLNTDTSNRQTQ